MSAATSPVPWTFVLPSGEVGALLASDGDKTSIEVGRPFPHGATVVGQLENSELKIELKVFRCQRAGSTYRIDGRLKNVSRALKAQLLQHLRGEGSGQGQL